MRTLKLALAGLCLLAAILCGCRKKDGDPNPASRPDTATVKVVVMEVKEASFEDWGSYSAELRGIEDANLTAPYQGGRVNMIKPIGTSVKAGDPLCDIDDEKYEAALKAAQAQVEVTQGDLERAKVNVEKGSLGRSALDGANLAYQNARMMLATARRAYEDCRCQAPFDGVLVSRSIEKYQTVAPGGQTVRLSRMDRFEAVISIPETEAFGYEDGLRTEFRLLQDSGRTYEGRLSSLDRAVDSRSRTAMARIEIPNRDGKLRPGMVGRARILRRTYAKGILIPATALLHSQSGVSVMVAENGIARRRPLEVGVAAGEAVLVLKGLRPKENLVVSGAFQLTDGVRISY
jgi:membrane fusion protein, multidrug efflux system